MDISFSAGQAASGGPDQFIFAIVMIAGMLTSILNSLLMFERTPSWGLFAQHIISYIPVFIGIALYSAS